MAAPDRGGLGQDPLLRSARSHGPYKVLPPAVLYEVVGRGGTGVVYRGRHLGLDVDVAVKCLRPSLVLEHPNYAERLLREARYASQVSHGNVVGVFGAFEESALHYLVMDFIDGETARQRVRRKGPLAEVEALQIVLGVATGAAAAHQHGLVHRDIKPENVLIAADGRVKLADLGMACRLRSSGLEPAAELAIEMNGTPQYMPPEQWLTGDVGTSADVWAIGATLWFLLAGRDAIDNGAWVEIGERIRTQPFPELPTVCAGVSEATREVVRRCVEREPSARFPDAKALVLELRRLVVEDPRVLRDQEAVVPRHLGSGVLPPSKAVLEAIRRELAATAPAPLRPPAPQKPPRGARGLLLGLAAMVLLPAGVIVLRWLLPSSGEAKAAVVGNTPEGSAEPVDATWRANLPSLSLTDLSAEIATLPGDIGKASAGSAQQLTLQRRLALALARKAELVAASGDDEALVFWQQAAAIDASLPVPAALAEQRERALARVREMVRLTQPEPDAVLPDRKVRVAAIVDRAFVGEIRVAVVPAASGDQPLPADWAFVPVKDGALEATREVPADGAFLVRAEVRTVQGVTTMLPPCSVQVDTESPQLAVVEPAAGAEVEGAVVLRGTVRDAGPCTVTVEGREAAINADGQWAIEVPAPIGEREFVVTARDRVGLPARVAHRLVGKTLLEDVEWLANGGCEEPLRDGEIPSWVKVSGAWVTRGENPAPFDGNCYFFAGNCRAAELIQDVPLAAIGNAVDQGRIRYTFRGRQRSFKHRTARENANPDFGKVVIECRDRDNAVVLDTEASGKLNNIEEWEETTIVKLIPPATRYLRIRLTSTRIVGNNNDAYFDGLSLRISQAK